MIVKMKKVMIATRLADRDKLLDSLAEIGIVHLSPVEPDLAVPPPLAPGVYRQRLPRPS